MCVCLCVCFQASFMCIYICTPPLCGSSQRLRSVGCVAQINVKREVINVCQQSAPLSHLGKRVPRSKMSHQSWDFAEAVQMYIQALIQIHHSREMHLICEQAGVSKQGFCRGLPLPSWKRHESTPQVFRLVINAVMGLGHSKNVRGQCCKHQKYIHDGPRTFQDMFPLRS